MEITKIEPNWMHGWANSPTITVTVDEENLEWIYASVPDENAREKTMLLSTNNPPWVKFVYIVDPNGRPQDHGALGGEYKMTDGSVFKTRTGWSSNAGAVNKRFAAYLEDEIVEVTLKVGASLWAGFNIYKDYLINHPLWPKDCYLVREEKYGDSVFWHISVDPNKVVKAPE